MTHQHYVTFRQGLRQQLQKHPDRIRVYGLLDGIGQEGYVHTFLFYTFLYQRRYKMTIYMAFLTNALVGGIIRNR